jgi:hydrogenase small subunit
MRELKILWLHGQGCSGCSISVLQSSHPSLEELIKAPLRELKIDISFHSLFTPVNFFGESEGSKLLYELSNDFLLVIEGSIPTKDYDKNLVLHVEREEIPFAEYIKKISLKALAVIAIGTCASFGGINALNPNLTGARGVWEILGSEYKSKKGLPVVNVPGCPPHPDWVIGTLLDVLLYILGMGMTMDLDEYNRPKRFYEKTVHENCPLAGFFSETIFSKRFGDRGCILALGCKGPVAHGDCVERKWNGGINSCTISGSVCIGCTEPGFPKEFMPFIYYPPKPLPLIIPSPASVIYLYGLYERDILEKLLKKKVRGEEQA